MVFCICEGFNAININIAYLITMRLEKEIIVLEKVLNLTFKNCARTVSVQCFTCRMFSPIKPRNGRFFPWQLSVQVRVVSGLVN